MQINDVIHGFQIRRGRALAELGGTLWELEHLKTGAKVCWLDRPDVNKTFSIAFKTLPEDSTGVFHILEHSVLAGSDRYPVKEPFVELLKTSVQTFLNAMTFPDKTVYPFSSRNDRDFLNLIDVYLDAVFHPSIYHKPEIFRQEGWRLEGEGEDLCLQGVVLNEMKGAYAAPDEIQERELSARLFPDTCYRHDYGGDPAHIPELTYEAFLDSHRRFYHPSNAWVALVGALDLAPCLEKLDRAFSVYQRRDCDVAIPLQAPVPAQRVRAEYPIGHEEDPANRTIVAQATVLSTYDDDLRNNTFSVLCDYLTGDDEAPLKRAVLDAGLAQDFSMGLNDGFQQTVAAWTAWNTDPERQPALEAVIRETLTRLTREGLDRERLTACAHRHAFRLRDRDSGFAPRSLLEAIDLLDDWVYGGDPAQGVLVEETIRAVEAALSTDLPETLLRSLFLENDHTVTLTLVPSAAHGDEEAAREAERLRAMTASWTQADREEQARRAEALRRWQQTPDSPEALATIPMLRLEDLAPTPEPLRYAETALEGVPVLRHSLDRSLAYLRAHFEASDLSLEELRDLAVLCQLLGAMGTARYDRTRLPLELKRTLGRVSFSPSILEGRDSDHCRVLFSSSLACLPDQGPAAGALLGEILTATVWEDLALLRDNLQQIYLNAQMALASEGQRYAMQRVAASLTAHGLAREYTAGITFARWVKELCNADDETLRALLVRLGALARRLTTRERLVLSASENLEAAALEGLLARIPAAGVSAPTQAHYPAPGPRREGVVIPGSVGFAVMGDALSRQGRSYVGSLPVLTNALNFIYLWSQIRVQGGAYGCGFGARPGGDLYFYTYRDPQPARSLEVFRGAGAWLRSFCAENPDLTGFILGSVSTLDPLRGEEAKIGTAEGRWYRGVTEAEICSRYRELLHTTAADLEALAPALEALTQENAFCVAAGKTLLDACGEEIEERLSL